MKKKMVLSEKPDMEWEHKDNHDTVMKAMEIMGDPEKMKHVHRISGKKSKAIRSLKDLHNKYNEMFGSASVDDKEEGKKHESEESKKLEKMGE